MYPPPFSQPGRSPRMTRARISRPLMAAARAVSVSRPRARALSAGRARWVLALLLPLMAASRTVRADDFVQLDLTDCAGARADEIARLVRLEPAAHGGELSAELRCSAERALISVRDPRRHAPLQLSLPLEGTQREARARFLALAIAELLATSRLEIESPSSTAEAHPRPYAVWVGAGAMRAFAPALFAPTLQLAAARSFDLFTLLADVDVDWAGATRAAAAISARALSLAIGPGLQLTAAAWTWQLALAVRAGAAWLRAQPQSAGIAGHTLSGAWFAPEAQSTLAFALSARVRVRLALQLGYVASPLRGLDADGGRLLELRGVRAAVLCGVGLAL